MSTADKLLKTLSIFTLEAPEWRIETAADVLGISTSTAYRYFTSLSRAGLLDPISSGRYILGPAIIAYDRQLRMQDPLIQAAHPALVRLLHRNAGMGVGLLCRRFRQEVMCIHQHFEHPPAHHISYERGRPMGLFRGAASRVVLAHLPARTIRALWNDDTAAIGEAGLGHTWPDFLATLRKIRSAGVCIGHGQLDPGMIGIAAPIFYADGRIAGSVSVVLANDIIGSDAMAGISELVQAAAKETNAALNAVH